MPAMVEGDFLSRRQFRHSLFQKAPLRFLAREGKRTLMGGAGFGGVRAHATVKPSRWRASASTA